MEKIIQKNQITAFLKKLGDYEIYGPVQNNETVTFQKLDGKDIVLDFANTEKPPKDVFFPQTEKMFDFVRDGKKFSGVEPFEPSSKPILVIGMRPCDSNAMNALDKLFSWDYIDPYYTDRRKRATIISLSCTDKNMPSKNCFCVSMGGNPSSPDGSDMLWTDLGDKYFVESFNEKGDKLVKLGGDIFKQASADDKKKAKNAKKKSEDSLLRTLNIDGVDKALEKGFDNEFWEQFSKRCLGCGVCTLLCPTCHCFDINDIVKKDKGWRERTWDTCQQSYYTIHASGHNPRPEKKHRQRNRVYHKLLYMNKNLDVLGCVGCGRCIDNCPVNIDIIELAEGIKKEVA
jgi:ferredoxin